jgi:hypothetical protein
MTGLQRPRSEPEHEKGTPGTASLASGFRCLLVVWAFLQLPATAAGVPWPVRVLHRLVAPFRSNPFLLESATPCGLGFAACFLPNSSPEPTVAASKFEPAPETGNPSRIVTLQLRALHGGPLSHHWLEVESSRGKVTIGFGPATVPFIDAGQISLQDGYGNIERISGMHPFPVLGMPPLHYRYAKAPGAGHPLGQPISLTVAQADALVRKARNHKFVGPYVPIFHDCRTFACTVQAAAQGRSSLPCYFLFKGYW